MKSFSSLEECIDYKENNVTQNSFIFKNDGLKNKHYTLANCDEIKIFQAKHKCNIYEYVNYDKPIRLFFYIINSKNNFDIILDNIIETLHINKIDLIIINIRDKYFKIIHKYYYFESFYDLDIFLLKFNLYNITLFKNEFMECIFNFKYITNSKYIEDIILNNVNELLLFPTNIQINKKNLNDKFISSIDFTSYDTLFIKSSMGSGKSTATVNYLKNNNTESFLILSCRKTLTYTIYNKLIENDISVTNYITTSLKNIKCTEKLIISPDSLQKIDYPLKKFDFIWIDEGVSFMYYIGNYLCMDNNTNSNLLNILEWLLKHCKKLLITDADLNDGIINYYMYFRNKVYSQFITYHNFKNSNKYNIYYNIDLINSELNKNLKQKKNIYICCDTLTKTKEIYSHISNLNIYDKESILLYNSESSYNEDKQMYDVNNFWTQYKIVIVSPKVVFGVDFNLEYFDYVYGFYKCNTLNVNECFQQLHRIRKIKENKVNIYICNKNNIKLDDSFTKIKYDLQVNNIKNLFFRTNNNNIQHLIHSLLFNITENGYNYIDMTQSKNYLIIYCIYEKNNSLNYFDKLMKVKIDMVS